MRFSIDKVQKVLREGEKWMDKCPMAMETVSKLHAMVKAGMIAESKVGERYDVQLMRLFRLKISWTGVRAQDSPTRSRSGTSFIQPIG